MGKRHHSKENRNLSSISIFKLFAVFSLMNTLASKKYSEDMDVENIKNIQHGEEYNEDKDSLGNLDNNLNALSPEDKLYVPVNTDSLMESYKKAISGDAGMPDSENYPDQNTLFENEQDDNSQEENIPSVISEILPLCESDTHIPEACETSVTIKIPVVLAKCTAAITVESSIKLKDNISEINRISKHVFLNQCKLAPQTENKSPDTSILFIDGFIRENIEYTAYDTSDDGNLKHTIFRVPFKCAANVTFKNSPEFKWNVPPDEEKITAAEEVDIDSGEKGEIPLNNGGQNLKFKEYFNEKVFCELISAEINGAEILENKTDRESKSSSEQNCFCFTEKAALFLNIELLQKQYVKIPLRK